jgi:hypothetical protein
MVSLSLPGSQECFLQKTKRVIYVCGSKILPPGVIPLQARDERADAIHACLGPAWMKMDALSEFFIAFNDPASDRSVEVSVEKVAHYERYYLSTTVARMNQLPLDDPPQTVEQLRPSGYCDALKATLADSRQKFLQSIKGAERNALPNRVLWRSNNQLPGWKDCFVHEWNGREDCRYLTCSLGNVADRMQAELLLDHTFSDVKACLGPEWRKSITRLTDGRVGDRLVSRDNPVIELHPSKSLYSEAWGLDLQILNEVVCPNPGM